MTSQHWNDAYAHGDETRSWFQVAPEPSLRILDEIGVRSTDSVIDVGGGASRLVDALLERGHTDITVLDVSAAALTIGKQRLGPAAERIHWLTTDLLDWRPERAWHVWHDRALLHFFSAEDARARYVPVLEAATETGSVAVLATFAPDGPDHCSGLPVTRYDADRLADLLGVRWRALAQFQDEHTTPAGVVQPFTWVAFSRGDY